MCETERISEFGLDLQRPTGELASHVHCKDSSSSEMEFNPEEVLIHWIRERESIRVLKEAGDPKPYTMDAVLRDHRFCNVHREHDRVTKWIFDNWLYPHSDSPNIAFAMCVARHFNWPDTLELIGFPHTWDPEHIRTILKHRRITERKKVYTGAYTISTGGLSMDKIDYSIDHVLTPLYKALRLPAEYDTLQSYWNYLQTHTGFASFMAGQVIADLKFISPLKAASDWHEWAPLGPGSIRGLNRYHRRATKSSIKQEQGVRELIDIQRVVLLRLGFTLALHNVQNCMCEFDKYIRIKYENGKVRAKYKGL